MLESQIQSTNYYGAAEYFQAGTQMDETVEDDSGPSREAPPDGGADTFDTLSYDPAQHRLALAVQAGLFPGLASPRSITDGLDDIHDGVLRIGRYTVLHKLGEGGMGVVYACYDDQLDRKLAVKVLRSRHQDRAANLRLEREAQGLAKLSHPNVVQIYEIGTHRDALFLAMEFVSGRTLRQWLRDSWAEREIELRERLRLLLQTGRGLAAAHAASLVHRDFKPDNIIVGEDGRARVLDFGLVRGLPSEVEVERVELVETLSLELDTEPNHPDDTKTPAAADVLRRPLTKAGSIVGTPAYMAPEQLAGQPCDALADQFAFCVVGFEVLFGCRPFEAANLRELSAAISSARIVTPNESPDIPRRVRAAMVRGLSVAPADRWPDMPTLLAELDAAVAELDGRRASRRSWAVAVALSASVAVTLGVALNRTDEQPALCTIDRSALVGAWDDARRVALHERFIATNPRFAEQLVAVTDQALDEWSDAWVLAQRQACEATWVSGMQSEAGLDKRTACLDRKRREFVGVIDVLLDADAKAVANTAEVLSRLPELGSCSHLASLELPFPRPSEGERLATLHAYEAKLDRARALLLVGERARAQVIAEELLERVADFDYKPLTLEVGALAADLSLVAQDFGVAVPAMLTVAREAEALHLDDLAATFLVRLARASVGEWSQPDKEAWLLADAEAALRRVGREDDPRELDLLEARAKLRCQAGDHEAALELYTLARDRSGDLTLYLSELEIANELTDLGRFDQADAAYRRTLDSVRARYGDAAPEIAHVELDLGLLALERGNLDSAERHLERAFATYSMVFGPSSRRVIQVRFAQAKLAMARGALGDARVLIDAVLAAVEAEFGHHHRLTAQALNGRGILHFFAGDYGASIVDYQSALAIQSDLLGPLHEEIGVLHSNIGESRVALGDHEQALKDFDRALVVLTSSAPDHPLLALPHKGRGQALLALGRPSDAAESLERALAITERSPGERYEAADIRLTLAQALTTLDREPGRARELAQSARMTFVEFGASEQVVAANAILGP